MAGAIQTTAHPSEWASYVLRAYFNKKLLPVIEENLVLAQFAQFAELPPNEGGKTMRFFKTRPADVTSIEALSEGTAISTMSDIGIGHIDVTLSQYGQAAKVSDIRNAVDLWNIMSQSIETMGRDAALKLDTVLRDAIKTGLANSDTQKHERFAGVTPSGDSSDDHTSLYNLTNAQGKITREAVLAMVTQLRVSKVPALKGGNYVCAIPAQVLNDLRQDDTWVKAATQVDSKNLYKWSIMTIDGVQFVEHTNPFRENATYGTHAANGVIYSLPFFGRGFVGACQLSKLGKAQSPQVIINDKADKTDPLNQYAIVGWKSYYGAAVLKVTGLTDSAGNAIDDVPNGGILRCRSTFV